jgi:hypothetical protein
MTFFWTCRRDRRWIHRVEKGIERNCEKDGKKKDEPSKDIEWGRAETLRLVVFGKY